MIPDVTSTYFEGQAEANPQAQRGYSRDHRPDCKLCIALVVTFDGFPLGYEMFAGSRQALAEPPGIAGQKVNSRVNDLGGRLQVNRQNWAIEARRCKVIGEPQGAPPSI